MLYSALSSLDDLDTVAPDPHQLPPMSVECDKCSALRYRGEPLGLCCSRGKVRLDLPPNLPEALHSMITGDALFRKNIRKYNQAFAFTSLGCAVDQRLANQREGVYTFRVNGQVHHRIGSVLPNHGEAPKFAQIYFYERDFQVQRRGQVMPGLDEKNVTLLTEMLSAINPYVALYKQAREVESDSFSITFRSGGVDPRRYNAPTVSEVGCVLIDEGDETPRHRDVRVRHRGRGLRTISELHSAYDPLMYVLLFPYGTPGWHSGLLQASGNRRITLKQFAAHRLMIRNRNLSTNPVHLGGRLTQQYVVDQYAKIESNNLRFISNNQGKLRADSYNNVMDAYLGGRLRTGRRVVLPSSFSGSPRHIVQNFQDSMSIVREYGKSDLFITITCNPAWTEIQRDLLHGQVPEDRPDLTARVFNMKLKAILQEITSGGIFGKCVAHVYTIEFQKRGLPHCHLLVWLDQEDKVRSADDIDKFVCAEIPDRETYPELHQVVSKSMVHGPCGSLNPHSPCMLDGVCTKGYPRAHSHATAENADGYPCYRRRNNGATVRKFSRGKMFDLDNRWIVPYNPYLLMRFRCHINVEICSSIQSVRYLHKYVHKGPDRASIRLENGEEVIDEVADYLEGRYISPVEAAWRIFGFKLHGMSHVITRLPVHLPNEHTILFEEHANLEDVVEEQGHSKLTAYFELCRTEKDARSLRFCELPKWYVWKAKKWVRRQRQTKNTIGRMYTVSFREGERFYLRMLLSCVKGATSFDDLRFHNGIQHSSFKASCISRGLLEDDAEWVSTIQDAMLNASPRQLRDLFATIIVFGQPARPSVLFQEGLEAMSADFIRQHHISGERVKAMVAREINKTLRQFGMRWSDFPSLALLVDVCPDEVPGRLLDDEVYGDELLQEGLAHVPEFNEQQRSVFDAVVTAVENRDEAYSNILFMEGCGGTGKTYVYNGLAAYFRSRLKIVLSVASSGIASLLLTGGQTGHSRFKIPLNLTSQSSCNIPVQSDLANLIRHTDLIIWDEAPMMHRFVFEALDRTLRDVHCDDRPMAGMVVLLGGDFRQILPVVPKGTRGQIVNASLIRSPLWRHVRRIRLTENMRVEADQVEFAEWLLAVGQGSHDGFPELPLDEGMLIQDHQVESLIESVFPDFSVRYSDTEYIKDRVILAPTHKEVNMINELITSKLPESALSKTYLSADSVEKEEGVNADLFPMEFLNSLQVNGLPPHQLKLTVGMIVMLLRNINKSLGLCNGTRLIVRRLQDHVVEAEVLTGDARGQHVYIPRLSLSPASTTLPFVLRRRQFPLKPAFAMTINKSQGQTLKYVGICLLQRVFCHGQLYVALSRARSRQDVKVLLPPGRNKTTNCVFSEVFQ